MQTKHSLFLVPKITPKSRANVWTQWMMSFRPRLLATDRSKTVILV